MSIEKEIHIICSLRAKKGHREEFQKTLALLVDPARNEKGCLYYHIFQNRNDVDEFFILDGWKDMDAVNAHIVHPNVVEVNKQLGPYLDGKQQLTWGQRIPSINENTL